MRHTLGIQEVADRHWVGAVSDVRRFEDLLGMCLRIEAHVLLAEGLCVLLDVCVLLQAVSTSFIGSCINSIDGCDDLQAAPTKGSS